MAKNDDGFYHTLRLSRRNPNHIRMHQILIDLDKSVYKSQNQFIVDAVEFYINALEEDVITNSGKQKRQENFATKEELQEVKESMRAEMITEVNKQILSVIGTFTGNLIKGTNINDTSKNDGFNADDTVMGLAEMWGE